MDWWHWLIVLGFLAFGVYTLVTGNWHMRGDPSPTMARVGGGLLVFIVLLIIVHGLGLIKQESD